VTTPQISFIVPLFNHLAHSRAMLDSLLASLPYQLDYEVVLVDDGSTDGTWKWLSSLSSPRIRKILNARNLGYARANNAGVKAARGKILGLLNNDLLFTPGWLPPMLDVLDTGFLDAGVVGNVQTRVDDGAVDHAGVELDCLGQFVHIRHQPQEESLPQKMLVVTGACMLIRKADFDAVGGFDEKYMNGCEDFDLCFKLRRMRKWTYLAAASQVRHHVSLSRDGTAIQNERNSRRLFGKWRIEIDHELTRRWVLALRSNKTVHAGMVDGELSLAFLKTPQLAARTLAESMRSREEARWSRELDGIDANAGLDGRCRVEGARYLPDEAAWVPDAELRILFDAVQGVRNFFICGRSAEPTDKRDIAIQVAVNGFQQKSFIVGPIDNINAGLAWPLLKDKSGNEITIRFSFVGSDGRKEKDASKSILLTHFVIDDQRVNNF
jgi:GT2 family glycosyltransferase